MCSNCVTDSISANMLCDPPAVTIDNSSVPPNLRDSSERSCLEKTGMSESLIRGRGSPSEAKVHPCEVSSLSHLVVPTPLNRQLATKALQSSGAFPGPCWRAQASNGETSRSPTQVVSQNCTFRSRQSFDMMSLSLYSIDELHWPVECRGSREHRRYGVLTVILEGPLSQ